MDRRQFLIGGSALVASTALPRLPAEAMESRRLTAKPATVAFFGPEEPATPVWAYDGAVPGPVLRAKQGESLKATLENGLADPTTIHWHGLRTPNAMDGVPFLTQPPVLPGEDFLYDIPLQDAGTFWYHPHVNSAEQVGRGLSGALVVEEKDPPRVDRDLVWQIDDWRLQEDGNLAPFGGFHDKAHGGRLGNVATINGKVGESLRVRAGERIRLRLVNSANARTFGLSFGDLDPWLMARDGHPVEPRRMGTGLVVLPPGGRSDLIIDLNGKPADKIKVVDSYYSRSVYTLAEIHYSDESPLRRAPLPTPNPFPANPVALPDPKITEIHEMVFQGGAMGGLRSADYKGTEMGLREIAQMGLVWAVNGKVLPPMEEGDLGDPMLDMKLGRTYRLRWRNDTAFDHPIHMHGHSFHLLSRNGKNLERPVILDTVLIQPDQYVDVAFVADNPGDWALHCHILEHAAAGMMGFLRVS
ncbi:multicopper oxidase family protein [Magnetospira sp. QH-2]|uniref:multicopper oxidase family protein n=1 Tax=Magnetospira sp. (strain QH-2) TaxID=1288970 RepID=UPI0003E81826|nr:multicopper oxidase family protein [Magnetospira sp. QH-2]CCQ74701.1 putative multicopper oxidase [Magnetospira sp. QH-2]